MQIQKIRGEIAGTLKNGELTGAPVIDEEDLSLKKLDEYNFQLQELQKEKVLTIYKFRGVSIYISFKFCTLCMQLHIYVL